MDYCYHCPIVFGWIRWGIAGKIPLEQMDIIAFRESKADIGAITEAPAFRQLGTNSQLFFRPWRHASQGTLSRSRTPMCGVRP